jgi:hypothetical protein
MRTAIDSNVISALWSLEPMASQIVALLGRAQVEGGLTVSAPVYAELLAHPKATPEFVNEFLAKTNITIDFLLAEEVWLLASESFAEYARKRRKSKGTNPKRFLADFIIGAHAMLRADRLLTLDRSRYDRSFPSLKLLP